MVSNLNLLESRRRILLITPHLESPTPANPLTFKSNMTTKLKEEKVYFTPIQEGTGDPSPDNVRPILGWDGVTLNVNGTTITIPFPQTIYGGYVDLVNGEVVEEHTAVTLDGENVKVNRGNYSTTNFYGAGWVYAAPRGLSTKSGKIYVCDRLPTGGSSTVLHLEASWTGSLYYIIRVIPKSDYPDELTDKEVIDLTNDWLKTNPVTVAYPLETPIHHTIDPQVIRPFKGTNTIWSDANGNIEIKFWKH